MRTKEPDLLAGKIADIILGAGGSLAFLIVLYSAYHFQGRNGISLDRLLICFVVPSFLVTLSFAGLRLGLNTKIGLSLLFVSAGFSIYALELFLSISGADAPAEWFTHNSPEERTKIAKKFGVEFDTRTKLEVIADLRKQGIQGYPYASASILLQEQPDGAVKSPITIDGAEVIPLGGISDAVTVLCNETGAYVVYKSDEYGFNNPRGLWDGRITVVALGDSFTHGSCVASEKQFVALIRKHHSTTLNLGGGGQGPLFMLAGLKEYVKPIRPPVVLWFYFEGNDIDNLRDERNSQLLLGYLQKDFTQNLRARQDVIDRALLAYIETAKQELGDEQKEHGSGVRRASFSQSLLATMTLTRLRQKLWNIYQQASGHSAAGNGEWDSHEAVIQLFGDILLEAKALVETWNGTIYFVYLPQWERYAKPALASKDRERVLSTAAQTGIRVIDIHKAFQAHGDPLGLFPFRQNAHYNEAGNRLVASEVLRVISPQPERVPITP
jgi:hypothetical protein